jgi:hypothetical protein
MQFMDFELRSIYITLPRVFTGLRYFFVVIFLAGMVFTVLNYIPILEEETPGHLIELCKKAPEKDSSDTSNDNDGDDTTESELNDCFPFYFSNLSSAGQKIADKDGIYRLPYYNSITPPPKS